MNCPEHDDAIVELARGVDLEPERMRAVRTHLAQCAACRARLSREESLTAGLGALSRSVAMARPSAELESRLLDAFHTAASATATAGQGEGSFGGRARKWRWAGLAAAAAVMLAVIPAWLLEPPPKPTPPPKKAAAVAEPIAVPRTPVVDRPAVPSVTAASGAGTARSRRRSQPPDRILRPAGFVALPGAAGLPQFESGVIARIEISVTSLPNYGIQIAPDAARSTVPA